MGSNVPRDRNLSSDIRYNPDAEHRRRERKDWLKSEIKREPVKIIARKTGLTEAAVRGIRRGLNGISSDAMLNWCENDPQFAQALASRITKSDPWTAAGAERPAVYQPAQWTADETGDEIERECRAMRERMRRGV